MFIDNLNTKTQTIGLNLYSDLAAAWYRMNDIMAVVAKRLFDLAVAGLGLLMLSPLLLVVAFMIRATSHGPSLFCQTRTGLNGQTFTILKFRTMAVHNDTTVAQAQKDDARITPLGRILRKTSIDELPQLINVLVGDMSIVGPRPHARAHDAYYAARIPAYTRRFAVKPGLTGLAQISNLRGETDTLDKMSDRIDADLTYIKSQSFFKDLMIVLKTPMSLVTSTQAY